MAKQSLDMDFAVPKGVRLKPVAGADGMYAAGSDGHIYCYSTARVNAKKPKPFRLRETTGSNGYPFVSAVLHGARKSATVHVLVCHAFHGPKPNGWCTRHLDGDKINNHPSNLKWGTFAENEADKRRHGTAAIGEKQGSAKLTDEAVRIIRASIPFGLWNTVDAAKVFGVSPSRICSVAKGIGWNHI